MKFTRTKRSQLTGETASHFIESSTVDTHQPFIIIGSPRGLEIKGYSPVLETTGDLEVLAQTIAKAWNEHLELKPKLELNSSGFQMDMFHK